MTRRDAMKMAAFAALATTTAAQAYNKALIVNKKDMKYKDPANPTKAELKHTPDIKVGSADAKGFALVEVEVGQQGIIHPSAKNHWIYEIELLADGNRVAFSSLEPEISRGYLSARVNVKMAKKLSAVAKCNLHGNYTSEVSL